MQYAVTQRDRCRICESERVVPFLTLPDMPLTDSFIAPHDAGSEFRWPVTLYYCEACAVTQTLHDVSGGDFYNDYQYTVAQSPFAQHFMRRLAEETWRYGNFQPGDAVVEVGSGDGAQLACFQPLGAKVFGFEPSAPLVRVSREHAVPVAECLFAEGAETIIPADLLPVQAIVLTYTFDHLPEPMRFLEVIHRVLDPQRGLLVIEVHDLAKIMERREYCLFQHEHTIYTMAATMQRLLQRGGFDLLTTELLPENERRGNSLLFLAGRHGSQWTKQGLSQLPLESYERVATYRAFGEAVHQSLQRLRSYIRDKRAQGVRLAGYGAGGRGVMTLAAVAEPGDFAYVCDQNPSFHGYVTPGAHVPVYGPEHLLDDPVDEVIVFSFGYFQEIYDSLAEFRARGGRLISLTELL